MIQRKTMLLAGVLSGAYSSVSYGFDWLINSLVEGAVGWLPQSGSLGQTILIYSYASNAIQFGIGVIGVAALGYWAGTHSDLSQEYRSLLISIGGGGVAGGVLVVLSLFLVGSLSDVSLSAISVTDAVLSVGMLGLSLLATGIRMALFGLAGAAIAYFSNTGPKWGGSETTASVTPYRPEPVE